MRVEMKVDLAARNRSTQPKADAPVRRRPKAEGRLRWLALALHIEELIQSSQASSLAEVARICGVSRARVSQVFGSGAVIKKNG